MVKASLYYDTRRTDKQGRGTIRIRVTKNGELSMFSTGISVLPTQWKDGRVVNHPDADILNASLSIKKGNVDRTILEKTSLGAFAGKKAQEIAMILQECLDPDLARKRMEKEKEAEKARNSFLDFFQKFMNTKTNKGTFGLYNDTLKKITAFCADKGIDPASLSFTDIDKVWLESFQQFCRTTQRQNTTARHLRDIKAVINAAIDNDLTVVNPFRKFKIKKEETVDKSFTAEELRLLFNYNCYPGGQEEAVDMFKLMFCLIGINSVDLAYADEMERGRLNYIRRKTHKPYSIFVEPEAVAIIYKYKGRDHLVNIVENYSNYKTFFNRMEKTLRKVGLERVSGKKSTGKALLPNITSGSARTSWATIAQEELDIPRDVIAAALGHHTVDVTSTYLRTDWRKKVDQANRRVLDWVFYGKK